MRNIFISAAAFAATFSFLVLVKVSDGASVSIITTTDVASVANESLFSSLSESVNKPGTDNGKVGTQEKEMLKSLVLSQLLRDSTTSSSATNYDDNNSYISSQVVNQSKKIVESATTTATRKPPNSKDIQNTTVTKKLKSNLNTASTTSWSSPLHVARCRATCIEKFQPSTSESVIATTVTNADLQEESISTTTNVPHLARLRAKRSPNHVLKSKSWSCVQSSSYCSSCWRNCELLEMPQSDGDSGKAAKTIPNPKQDTKAVNPVVATKHQYSLKITPGKLSWPAFPANSPVVYVVMQEYPDRNWRQLSQTTQTEIEVNNNLTSSEANSMNLNSVRVLVVDKIGLRLVYNPVTARKSEQAIDSTENLVDNLLNLNETTASSHITPKEINAFELRVVSLIHQTSLVIAELRWNSVRNNPDKDYLITWVLSGGGLKGHLVTDSTSVTLSLWPDSSYTIHVQTFQQANVGVYEEPRVRALQSLPLTVDTGKTSFTLGQPFALLSTLDMDTDDNDENLSMFRGEEKVSMKLERIQPTTRVSASLRVHHFTGLLNMTLMVSFAISALLFVILIFIVTAFTWTRMRAVENYPQWIPNSPANLDECSNSPILSNPTEHKCPMNYAHCNNAWVENCHYPRRNEECGEYFGLEEVSRHCPCKDKNFTTGMFDETFESRQDSSVAVISLNDKREVLASLIRPTFSAEASPYLVFGGEREKTDSSSHSRLVEDSCSYPRQNIYH